MNPDPLAPLRPLHLPDQIGWWPPAPGWWLLGGIAAVLACTAVWLAWRYLRRNRYRRVARRELQAAFRQCRETQAGAATFAAQASRILRRAALVHYPRHQVAALCAEQWLDFLDSSARTRVFREGPGRALADAPYNPGSRPDDTALHEACRQWLRRHR